MTRLMIPMLGLAVAGVVLCCSGTRADAESAAALSVGRSSTQPAVGQSALDDDDEAADDDDRDEDGDEHEHDVAVALTDVPQLVLDAAQAALPGVVLTSAEIEQEDGQVVYSLSGTLAGEAVEIEVSATGTVLEIERG